MREKIKSSFFLNFFLLSFPLGIWVGAASPAPSRAADAPPANPEVNGCYVQVLDDYSEYHFLADDKYAWGVFRSKQRLDLLELTESGLKVDQSYPISAHSQLFSSPGAGKAVWLEEDRNKVTYLDPAAPPKTLFTLDQGRISGFFPCSDGQHAWVFCNFGDRLKIANEPRLVRLDAGSGEAQDVPKDKLDVLGQDRVELVNEDYLVLLESGSNTAAGGAGPDNGSFFMKLSVDGTTQNSEVFHRNSIVRDPDHSIWPDPDREGAWFESDTEFPTNSATFRRLDGDLKLKKYPLNLESGSDQIKVIPLGNQKALVLDLGSMVLLDPGQAQPVSVKTTEFSPESGQFLADPQNPGAIWFYSTGENGEAPETRLWLYDTAGGQIQQVLESQPLPIDCLALMPGLDRNSVWVNSTFSSNAPASVRGNVPNTGLYLYQANGGIMNGGQPELPDFGKTEWVSGNPGQCSLFQNTDDPLNPTHHALVYEISPGFLKGLHLDIGKESLTTLSDTHSVDIDLSGKTPVEVGFDFSGEGPVYFSNEASFRLSFRDSLHSGAEMFGIDLPLKTRVTPDWKLDKGKIYDMSFICSEPAGGTRFTVTWHGVSIQYPWYKSSLLISLAASLWVTGLGFFSVRIPGLTEGSFYWIPRCLPAAAAALAFCFPDTAQGFHLDPVLFTAALFIEMLLAVPAALLNPAWREPLKKAALFPFLLRPVSGRPVLEVKFSLKWNQKENQPASEEAGTGQKPSLESLQGEISRVAGEISKARASAGLPHDPVADWLEAEKSVKEKYRL